MRIFGFRALRQRTMFPDIFVKKIGFRDRHSHPPAKSPLTKCRASSGDAGDAESWKLFVFRAVSPVMRQYEKPPRHLIILKIR